MQGPQRIAIDGPAGSGKSTIGERLARQLSYLYIDTGAMYRAVAWLALHRKININDGPALGNLARHADIEINHPLIDDGRQYTVIVHGHDITWDIRAKDVTRAVSTVSAHPEVRSVLIAQQRKMGERQRVVMVGRDIGAVVLPQAELKIYLTASLKERARRRRAELAEHLREGNPSLPSLETMMDDIQLRDDTDRENMLPARDAIFIETDHLNISQVLAKISQYVEELCETRYEF
jgi:cytidylate kinase